MDNFERTPEDRESGEDQTEIAGRYRMVYRN
jgi:hypothetical protein